MSGAPFRCSRLGQAPLSSRWRGLKGTRLNRIDTSWSSLLLLLTTTFGKTTKSILMTFIKLLGRIFILLILCSAFGSGVGFGFCRSNSGLGTYRSRSWWTMQRWSIRSDLCPNSSRQIKQLLSFSFNPYVEILKIGIRDRTHNTYLIQISDHFTSGLCQLGGGSRHEQD